jgi:hypothetical protein
MDEATAEAALIAEATRRGPGPCTLKEAHEVVKTPKLAKATNAKISSKLKTEIVVTTPTLNPGSGRITRSKTVEERKDGTSTAVLTKAKITSPTLSPGTGRKTRSQTIEERKDVTSTAVLTVGPGAHWSESWNEMNRVQEVKEAEVENLNDHSKVTQEEPNSTNNQV